MLAKLFLRSERALTLVEYAARDLHQSLWLGVLTRNALAAVDQAFYDTNGRYLSRGHNLQGLFHWETRALENHFGACKKIAVVGTGAGREVIALDKLGFDVAGYECHPRLVDLANRFLAEEGLRSTVSQIARDSAPTGQFDAVIVGWGVYTVIQGRDNRIAFLRSIAESLPSGAPILLSYFQRPEGSRRYKFVSDLGTVIRRLRRADAVEQGDRLVPHFTHAFTGSELTEEVTEAGYRVVYSERQPYPHAVAIKRGRGESV